MMNDLALWFWKWVAIGMFLIFVGPIILAKLIHCYYKLKRRKK